MRRLGEEVGVVEEGCRAKECALPARIIVPGLDKCIRGQGKEGSPPSPSSRRPQEEWIAVTCAIENYTGGRQSPRTASGFCRDTFLFCALDYHLSYSGVVLECFIFVLLFVSFLSDGVKGHRMTFEVYGARRDEVLPAAATEGDTRRLLWPAVKYAVLEPGAAGAVSMILSQYTAILRSLPVGCRTVSSQYAIAQHSLPRRLIAGHLTVELRGSRRRNI